MERRVPRHVKQLMANAELGVARFFCVHWLRQHNVVNGTLGAAFRMSARADGASAAHRGRRSAGGVPERSMEWGGGYAELEAAQRAGKVKSGATAALNIGSDSHAQAKV